MGLGELDDFVESFEHLSWSMLLVQNHGRSRTVTLASGLLQTIRAVVRIGAIVPSRFLDSTDEDEKHACGGNWRLGPRTEYVPRLRNSCSDIDPGPHMEASPPSAPPLGPN